MSGGGIRAAGSLLTNCARQLVLVSCALVLASCTTFAPPPDLSGNYSPCCDGLGTCVPSGLVPATFQSMVDRGTCGEFLSCVPSDFLSGSGSASASCVSSLLGAEGRCLPACIPAVRARARDLAEDGCGPARLCVPCFDPINGAATGACSIQGDTALQSAKTFATCCGGEGRCVPRAKVPADLSPMLPVADCAPASDTLCVAPRGLLETGDSFVAASCVDEVLGSEGRCLPQCLPMVAAQASRLRRAGCGPAQLCVPCFDPLAGALTGACELGGDPGPARAPRILADCCDGLGRCAPRAAIPPQQAAQLDRDACVQGELCVAPEELLLSAEHARLGSCYDPQLKSEGRCMPACLPLVRARSSALQQHGCAAGMLCAPCFDPISNEPTGACSVGADQGPIGVPVPLAACCAGAGRCAPRALVPASVASRFVPADCPAPQEQLCVAPLAALTDPERFRPPRCTVPALVAEGRCLPECLPQVAAQASRLERADCAEASRCVPCFDPIEGGATGACTINGDAPSEPARPFAGCCVVGGQALGVCVPPALLPESTPMLPQQSCEDGTSCAPRSLAVDPTARLPACTSALGSAGACLPSCFLDSSQSLLFSQGSCAAGERCVPCEVLGTTTGVCQQ